MIVLDVFSASARNKILSCQYILIHIHIFNVLYLVLIILQFHTVPAILLIVHIVQ